MDIGANSNMVNEGNMINNISGTSNMADMTNAYPDNMGFYGDMTSNQGYLQNPMNNISAAEYANNMAMNYGYDNMDPNQYNNYGADPSYMYPLDPPVQNVMPATTQCYGEASKIYANQLIDFVNDEYRDYMYYSILAKRAPTANARQIFRNIARTELSHSKKFAAAYFLITGKRYVVDKLKLPPVNVPASYQQALRERYIAELNDIQKYRNFADRTNDVCLKSLAYEVSEEERQHAQHILELIQSM